MRELGETIDLHGGGSDLIFPHHECESAQSQAATGEPFVRHWMHVAMVRMDGEKMSKSLGNLVFVRDLLEKWEPQVVRLGVLAHHYRDSWEWNDNIMPRAAERLEAWRSSGGRDGADDVLRDVRAALDNDLDTPLALSLLDGAARKNKDVRAGAELLGVRL
jgi:L-cysteine:1D-myo-inositol 2-amino-2-deoxy-alpha-D-glucopyranoside ligase